MKCHLSGRETPIDKLFVLYYPPTMAHYDWDKSVFAAARASEALRQTRDSLKTFYWRYVAGPKLPVGLTVGVVGVVLGYWWIQSINAEGVDLGFFRKYVVPLMATVFLLSGLARVRAFLRRSKLWKARGRKTVADELQAIEDEMAKLPEDPTAEQGASFLRRRCPDVISELAFEGRYFHADTYLDFVLYPQLRNPRQREELPDKHSLYRDAYYVGELVYDGWRLFHHDTRELVDPRFVGSGGRRGVI